MTQARPNVLALTVDALRADRMSLYGYERPTSPSMEKLGADSIVCDNALTMAPFTQAACIQLFTSSRPLSYGGYDAGARGRPITLFEHFKNAGYSTWGLSTIHWVSPYYGYTGGLEQEHGVFHLNTMVGMAVVNMRDTLYYYRAGSMETDEMLTRVTPVIERMFDNIHAYSDVMRHSLRDYKLDFPAAKISHDCYDFNAVQAVVVKHRSLFRKDPLAYISTQLTNLTRAPDAHEWIAGDWYYRREPIKLVCEFLFRASNKALRFFNPAQADKRAASVRLAVDAHAIANKVISALRNYDPSKPFFIWAHFKDTHRPFVSGPGLKWYDHTPDYLAALGYPRALDPTFSFREHYAKNEEERETLSALYDAAVLSTDEAIGRIITEVKNLGLYDETVIGMCGDHGEEIGEHGDYGHECMAYEHNSRVPMVFKPAGNASATGHTDTLITSLDFAPTLSSLADIDPASGWAGANVNSSAAQSRDHIVTETFCRGNCLFDLRPLYMGVRTKQHKYLWCEGIDPHHKRGTPEPRLYDLSIDPLEQNNIYRADHPLVTEFNQFIANRLNEVPEISSSRIKALLSGEADSSIKEKAS